MTFVTVSTSETAEGWVYLPREPVESYMQDSVQFKAVYDKAAEALGRSDHITMKALREAAGDMDRAEFDGMIAEANDAGLIDLGADFVTGDNADSVYTVARPGEDDRDVIRFGSVTWKEDAETSIGAGVKAKPEIDLTRGKLKDEVMLTPAEFEELEKAAPELALTVKNDVRRGARGLTTNEGVRALEAKAAETARVTEAKAFRREMYDKARGAQMSGRESQNFATFTTAIGMQLSRMTGKPIGEVMNFEMARERYGEWEKGQGKRGDVYNQPVNPDVDMDAEVDIVDINLGQTIDAQLSTKEDLRKHIKGFVGKPAMISADSKAKLKVSSNSKAKHIVQSSKPTDTYIELDARNAALNSVDDVVKNSVLIESFPEKDKTKNDVENVHRLYVPMRIGNDTYVLRVVAHEMKDESGLKPIEANLYDLIFENKDSASSGSLVRLNSDERVSGTDSSGIKITIRDMLRGVKDAQGQPYIYEQAPTVGSEAFKKWFGESKVVDGSGEPLVMYHGTSAEFDAFSKKMSGTNTLAADSKGAFFFTTSDKVAEDFAGYFYRKSADGQSVEKVPIEGAKIMPVYLRAENPVVWDMGGGAYKEGFLKEAIKDAKKNGHDSIVFRNMRDGSVSTIGPWKQSHVIVVFSPTQIKSVDNRGTWSNRSSNIYEQAAYHGGPYRGIDRFSLDKIGTGEGAQAYGWGLYFAENKEVSEIYRKTLVNRKARKPVFDHFKSSGGIAYDILGNGNYVKSWHSPNEYHKETISEIEYQEAFQQAQEQYELAINNNGQLYGVEVPESDVLLDWDKPFSKQPKKVREALSRLFADRMTENYSEGVPEYSGQILYNEIVYETENGEIENSYEHEYREDSGKAASLLLDQYGIPGLQYLDQGSRDDGEGTHNFVVWNEDVVDVMETYYQDEIDKRASAPNAVTRLMDDMSSIITLFETANVSSPYHEIMHHTLNVFDSMADMELVDEQFRADFETILKENGVTREQFRADANARRRVHEGFARGFETYLATGEAPSKGLRAAFARVRQWLLDLYGDVQQALGVELSSEMRDVYDRLLATPEEITAETEARTTVARLEEEARAVREELRRAENDIELTKDTVRRENSREVSAVEERKKIDYRTLRTESGRSIEEADKSELIITPDGSPALGFIDEETAKDAGIAAGEIHVNAGMIQHAESGIDGIHGHGKQIRNAGYKDTLNMVLDVLQNYDRVFEGSDNSILLTAKTSDKNAIVAIELSKDESGVYNAKTAWIVRDKFLEKKKLLSARREPTATVPASGLISHAEPHRGQDDSATNARQESNSHRTLPPPTENVNSSDTDTEISAKGRPERGGPDVSGQDAESENERLRAENERFKKKEALTKRLKAKRDALRNEKADILKTVKKISNMAKDTNIIWGAQQEIKALLEKYDLKRRAEKAQIGKDKIADKEDRKAAQKELSAYSMMEELEDYIAENPEAEADINPKDKKTLGKTPLNDLTIGDIKQIAEDVTEIYERGQREYAEWEASKRERRDKNKSEVFTELNKRKVEPRGIVTGNEEPGKQYKGIAGDLEKAKDWGYGYLLDPQRFFDWLGGGMGSFKSVMTRFFVDRWNANYDVQMKETFRRLDAMQEKLNEIGINERDLTKRAATIGGVDFTFDEIMEIYAGLRNEKKRAAILYGNLSVEEQTGADKFSRIDSSFKLSNLGDPMAVAQELISMLSEEQKAAALLVIADNDANVDRIDKALIEATNQGMDREEEYSSIHRTEYMARGDVIDADMANMIESGEDAAGVMARINDGFTKKRQTIADDKQASVKLGLFSNWNADVARQEHAAAFASYARDVASLLMSRDPANQDMTFGKMIRDRFGNQAWKTLIGNVNVMIRDDVTLAQDINPPKNSCV